MGNFIYWTEPYAIPIETNDWVFDVLDFTTGISLLLGLISIYIFYTQSPPNMLTFSRVLIVYQVVALTNDVMLGTGLAPYFTFPCPGGVPTGWLKRFGLSSFAQLIIGCALLGHSSGLIMIMFVVRQQYILPIGHPFKMKLRTKVILYLLLQILPYCHSILGLLYMEKFNDLSITRHYYFAKYPALTNFIAHPGFYSLLPDDAFTIACHMLFWAGVGMVLVGGACLSCFHVLESSKSRVSAKTLASYRWIILKLAIQVCIPMFTLLIPGACAVFLFFLEDPNWIIITPFGTGLMAQHSLLSTCMSLYLYIPYSSYIRDVFERCLWILVTGKRRPSSIETSGATRDRYYRRPSVAVVANSGISMHKINKTG